MLISKFSGDGITEQIEAYGDLNDVKFPEQLRTFLEQYNGGETPKTSFSCAGVSSDLRAFYGMGRVKYSYDSVKPISQNGKQYLPIALDSFGNEIVISVEEGQIYFWDHENGSITWIAAALRDFFQACRSEKINPAARKTIQEREQDLIKRGKGSVITDALRAMWQAEIDKYGTLNQEEVRL